MTDAAFSADFRCILDYCESREVTLDNQTAILEEAKRIYRLCLHNKIRIAPCAEHERAFCLLCSLASKSCDLWSQLVQGGKNQRVPAFRIRGVGLIVLADLLKFMRIAESALKVTGVSAVLQQTAEEVASGPSTKKGGAPAKASGAATIAPKRSKLTEERKPSTEKKKGKSDVSSKRCAGLDSGGVDDATVCASRSSDDENDIMESVSSSSHWFSSVRDWNTIALKMTQFQAQFPSWRCGCAFPIPDGILPDPTLALLGVSATIKNAGGATVCIICSANVEPESSHDPAEHCCECSAWTHLRCFDPPMHDIPRPFLCDYCRIHSTQRKRLRGGEGVTIERLVTNLR